MDSSNWHTPNLDPFFQPLPFNHDSWNKNDNSKHSLYIYIYILPVPVNSRILVTSLVPLQYHISTTNTPIKLVHCLIYCSEYCSDTGMSEKMYVTNSSRYERSICQGLSNVVRDTKNFWTMAPQPTCKCLGVGASCTIKLRFLHSKNMSRTRFPTSLCHNNLPG